MPTLCPPTAAVDASYLHGEAEMCAEEGTSSEWLQEAARDFGSFVERRRLVRELWGVPTSELWFIQGTEYIGTVMVRHRLTRSSLRPAGT